MITQDNAYAAYKRLLYVDNAPFEVVHKGRRHIAIRQRWDILDTQTREDLKIAKQFFEQSNTRLQVLPYQKGR
jgi:hypothetical protein